MLATRWQPRGVWTEMNRLQEEMDRLFGRSNGGRRFGVASYPPINLWQDDDNLYVEAELPGFELSGLEITATGDNQLSLKGAREQPELEGGTWHRQERGYGKFSRIIELPDAIDPDKVVATLKDGVLTITLPKREEAKPRRIEVKPA